MKAYLLMIIIFTCCICRYTSVEIMPELEENILIFGYRSNFTYEGMLAHSFDRFYVVTKFILPSVNDVKFSSIGFDEKYNYLNDNIVTIITVRSISLILKYTVKRLYHLYDFIRNKFLPIIAQCTIFWQMKYLSILPNFPKARKERRGIIALLVTGFIGLAYEGISSYLHNHGQKPLLIRWLSHVKFI